VVVLVALVVALEPELVVQLFAAYFVLVFVAFSAGSCSFLVEVPQVLVESLQALVGLHLILVHQIHHHEAQN